MCVWVSHSNVQCGVTVEQQASAVQREAAAGWRMREDVSLSLHCSLSTNCCWQLTLTAGPEGGWPCTSAAYRPVCVCLCVLVCVCVVTGRLEATRDQHMMTRQNRAHTHTLCAQRSSCSFRNNGGVYCRALWDCIVFCNDDRMQWELKASMKSTHLFNCKIDLTTFLWDSNSLLVFKST